eukprot:2015336-Rhodomonas_salina.1
MILGLQPRTPREGRLHNDRPSTARELYDRQSGSVFSPRQRRPGPYERETAVKRSTRMSAAGILEHDYARRPLNSRRVRRRAYTTEENLVTNDDDDPANADSEVNNALRLARVAREQLAAAASEEQRIRTRLADAGDQLWRAQLQLDHLQLPRETVAPFWRPTMRCP